jgi:hypothetical protein
MIPRGRTFLSFICIPSLRRMRVIRVTVRLIRLAAGLVGLAVG